MNLKFSSYDLPFVNPLQTSKKTFDHREGCIIEYTEGDFRCYGEAAPLPGFSNETLKDVRDFVVQYRDEIASKFEKTNPIDELQKFYKENKPPASLQFGLDSLAYQIVAHQKNSSVIDYLFPKSPSQIQVNALVSLQATNFLNKVQEQVAKGYQTVKFKIGLDFHSEIKRLQKIRTKFPGLTIRLDANQAWSLEVALTNLQNLEPLNIEYCEEPLEDPTPGNFEDLHEHCSVPLALDESFANLSYWPNLLPYTSYLIFKPMLLGSFTKNIETKRLADTHNNKAVFTTSLESGIGRQMTAILAAGLGSSQTAHGLTTGKFLAKDLHSDIAYISEGAYHLNQQHPSNINYQHLDDVR